MSNKHKKHFADEERTDVLKTKKKNNNAIKKKQKKGKKKGKKYKQEPDQKKVIGQKEKNAQKKKSEQKDKNNERVDVIKEKIIKNIRKFWKKFKWNLIVICILTPIIAYIFEKIGYGKVIKYISTALAIIICTGMQIVYIAGKLKENGLINETHTIQLGMYVKEAFSRVLHNKKRIQIIMTALIILISAIGLSKYKVYARTKEGVNAFKSSFLNYEEKEETKLEEGDKTGEEVTEEPENNEEKITSDMSDDITGEDLYVYTKEEIIEQFGIDNYMEVKNILMSCEDKNLEKYLPYDDYAQIFFQNGKYKIKDWNNQTEIDEKVFQRIEDEIAQNKQNIFDESAPEDLKNKIDAVRKKGEEKITFAERIEITTFREITYEQYPKSKLALLTANDNQAYAMAFVIIGGKQQTQMYYYGQSVLWGLKYISYEDVSERAIIQRINWIAKRYEDIRFICFKEDTEYMYADRLMTAYRHAAASFEEKGDS